MKSLCQHFIEITKSSLHIYTPCLTTILIKCKYKPKIIKTHSVTLHCECSMCILLIVLFFSSISCLQTHISTLSAFHFHFFLFPLTLLASLSFISFFVVLFYQFKIVIFFCFFLTKFALMIASDDEKKIPFTILLLCVSYVADIWCLGLWYIYVK